MMIITADDSDELRDLEQYLLDTDELRGRVRQLQRPPGPEDMGPVLDALEILVSPGGVTAATATMVIAWLRSRRGTVRLKVRGDSGRIVELDARGATGLDAEGLQQLTTSLVEALDQQDQRSASE
ncbi:effector-associated constant component EACC1 [Nocardia asteroides]|uniref:effector-associated constant component EACC1 n=1 Tax=Nocardia asteroides TaxID=1824 RepID=UPI0034331527